MRRRPARANLMGSETSTNEETPLSGLAKVTDVPLVHRLPSCPAGAAKTTSSPIGHGCVLRLGAAVPKPVLWRRRSAAAGGEKQHQPGEPAVDQVEASVVEEPFHLATSVDA